MTKWKSTIECAKTSAKPSPYKFAKTKKNYEVLEQVRFQRIVHLDDWGFFHVINWHHLKICLVASARHIPTKWPKSQPNAFELQPAHSPNRNPASDVSTKGWLLSVHSPLAKACGNLSVICLRLTASKNQTQVVKFPCGSHLVAECKRGHF